MSYYVKKHDKELSLAYVKGILDERREWKERDKEFKKKIYLIKRQKRFCFCMGDRLWTAFCKECQDFFRLSKKQILQLK